MPILRSLLPLALLLLTALIAWQVGWVDAFSWTGLARHRVALVDLATAHPILAPGCYMMVYATLAAISFPAGALLTVTGGFLFGPVRGCVFAVVGATCGATVLFLAARSVLSKVLAQRGGNILHSTIERLRRDGFLYLLALRLLPIVPFWLINLAAAFCGMRVVPFVVGTVIGMVPVAFVFASIGAGIGDVLAAGGRPDLSVVFGPTILLPLLGLAGLLLVPILLKGRRGDGRL